MVTIQKPHAAQTAEDLRATANELLAIANFLESYSGCSTRNTPTQESTRKHQKAPNEASAQVPLRQKLYEWLSTLDHGAVVTKGQIAAVMSAPPQALKNLLYRETAAKRLVNVRRDRYSLPEVKASSVEERYTSFKDELHKTGEGH